MTIKDFITNTVCILEIFSNDLSSMYLYSIQLFNISTTLYLLLHSYHYRTKDLVHDLSSFDDVTVNLLMWMCEIRTPLNLFGSKMSRMDSFDHLSRCCHNILIAFKLFSI